MARSEESWRGACWARAGRSSAKAEAAPCAAAMPPEASAPRSMLRRGHAVAGSSFASRIVTSRRSGDSMGRCDGAASAEGGRGA